MSAHHGEELLVGRAFEVVSLDGADVHPGTPPTLRFDVDGRLSGHATVNRIAGPYSVAGDTLRCGPLAATLMAGLPEAMEQERRVLEALAQPLDVRPAASGDDVELAAGETVLLVLRPAAATEAL